MNVSFKAVTVITIILILGLSIASCQPQPTPATLRYGLTLAPSGLDPHIHASAELGIPLHSVYDTLVVRHPESGEFLPSLALHWDISTDGLFYTFDLRRDVIFHDGSRFDAEAAVANFEYIIDPDHNSQKAAAMLGPFKQAEALDPYKLQITLEEPFSPLLDSLSQVYLGMASPGALAEWGPSEYQFHQVGTGPYRFIEYIPNDRIVLERYANYDWGSAIYQNKTATLERVEFLFYEDEATRALALERGEVDIIGEVPPQDALRLSQDSAYKLLTVPIPGQPLQFFFNTAKSPTDDLIVRQALQYAVDRSRIIQTIFGNLSPVAKGPLSSYPFAALMPDHAQVSDLATATSRLERSGWVDSNGDGIREKDQHDLMIDLIVPPWGSNPETAQLLKVDWESLGAVVNLEVVPSFGTLKQRATEGNFHAIGLNFFGTDPDLLRSFYLSDGVYNWSNFQSDQLDGLLRQGAIDRDMAMRNDLYRQVIDLISAQALILPVRDYVNLIVYRSSLSTPQFSAQGWFPHLIDLEFES